MVTRRAVLKGTAAASIGAIAAAKGATPVDAAALDAGWGNISDGGAAGAFWKYRDAFQIAVKFQKIAAEVFLKDQIDGGVAIFFKFFEKQRWSQFDSQKLSDAFPNLAGAELNFVKLHTGGAEFFVKIDRAALTGSIETSKDGIFYKFEELKPNTDGNIG